MKKVPKLFLICDICDYKEEPSFALSERISNDEITENELPMHCATGMRITILEVEQNEKVKVNIEGTKWGVIETLKVYFLKVKGREDLGTIFEKEYENYLSYKSDLTELMSLFSLRKHIRPALQEVIEEDEIEIPLKLATDVVDRVISRVQEELLSMYKQGGKSNPLFELKYFCTVCEEFFDIPPKDKSIFLAGDEDLNIPTHHEKRMDVRISRLEGIELEETKTGSKSSFFNQKAGIERMELLSVGLDVGSSTSHLVFSKLKLEREQGFLNMTYRFNIKSREILYRGKIINTPLLDTTTIDIEKIVEFFKSEFKTAGYKPEDVDTGAVIVTGETAKKSNAAEIVERLSDETGKFVCATAGPNFESLLAAMGSGAMNRSLNKQNTILSIDVGGGTSNLAISSKGHVISTSCINVGGRLLGIDENRKIWRIDEPTKCLFEIFDMDYGLEDTISDDDLNKITNAYSSALIEVMQGPARTDIAKMLMMTGDLDFSTPIDEIMFCGGVSEFMYGETKHFDDIGYLLAEQLVNHDFGIPVIPPNNTIRATVIGAGSYSLAVSGSTCFYDDKIDFPKENIPVLKIDALDTDTTEDVTEKIKRAFQRFDLIEGEDLVGLFFPGMPIIHRDMYIPPFVKAIEAALPNSVEKQTLILLLFQFDMAGMVGRTLMKETEIKSNFMSIDELDLAEGDFIDIGAPLKEGHSFPIVVKSLVFN